MEPHSNLDAECAGGIDDGLTAADGPSRAIAAAELTSTVGRIGKNDAREGVSSHRQTELVRPRVERFARIVFAIRETTAR
jgi:hypothetical protein